MDMSPIARIVPILGLLAFVSASELIIPLRTQARNLHGRLGTNLVLTAVTLLLAIVFNGLLLAGAAIAVDNRFGLLPSLHVTGFFSLVVTIIFLDFATHLAHVTMHKFPWAWRIHLVHHIDAAVDATTALRQHPLEGLVRFAALAVAVVGLGVTPAAFAIYRMLSTANAIVEHANIRLPKWLESVLVAVWVTPNMHKMHHSRIRKETDSNYGNLFSCFDRLFRTYTRGDRAQDVAYGIAGHDSYAQQSIKSVLNTPFKPVNSVS